MSDLFTSMLVGGADAKSFLQGQLTCDMDQLTADRSALACVNSPQGRVQAVLTVTTRDAGFALSVVSPMAERTVQRLRKYVLRSKVTIALGPTTGSTTLLSQLRAGIPHVFPETYESFVAQMLNLDVLGAISFSKGCYTGQEIIARTHYRGAIKRRMFRFAAPCAPPPPGTRILSGDQHAGDVVYADDSEQGCEVLAVINLAQLETSLTLDVGAAPLTRLTLPYSL